MAFYDDIVADCDKNAKPMADLFRRAKIVHCDNVFEYYAHDIPDDTTLIKQVNLIVPPFELTWLEMRAVDSIVIDGQPRAWLPGAFTRAGILVRTFRVADGWYFNYSMFLDMPNLDIPDGPEYFRFPFMRGRHEIAADGTSRDGVSKMESMPGVMEPRLQSLMIWSHSVLNDVMLLAFSFLNCKNVLLDAAAKITPPRTPEDKRLNRWPVPEHEFHTLRIMPLRELTRGAGGGVGDSSKAPQRLHIVRGHFARYTEDKPLLGKAGLFGQFWIPQHARGSSAQGDINADYDIKP